MPLTPLVGVLALQGDFEAHTNLLRQLGADVREVRVPADLDGLDGLVLPGGESTVMTLGIEREGLADPLRALAASGTPVLGTCAGLIMLDREHLGIMDILARRNAFGRQIRSFEVDLDLGGLSGTPAEGAGPHSEVRAAANGDAGADGSEPLRAVFIRAPWIEQHGPGVEVLAEVDGHPVAAREGNVIAIAFHPEISGEPRVHERFLTLVRQGRPDDSGPSDNAA